MEIYPVCCKQFKFQMGDKVSIRYSLNSNGTFDEYWNDENLFQTSFNPLNASVALLHKN